jgi:hypothetical protein
MQGTVVSLARDGPEEDCAGLWRALADPTRRRILDLLRERPRVTGEIASHFAVSRIAVMRHLEVLSDAGLATSRKRNSRNCGSAPCRTGCASKDGRAGVPSRSGATNGPATARRHCRGPGEVAARTGRHGGWTSGGAWPRRRRGRQAMPLPVT